MMHTTGNQQAPFVVIPESEYDETRVDWRLKAAPWGLGSLLALAVVGELVGPAFAAPEVTHYQVPAARSPAIPTRAPAIEKRASAAKTVSLASAAKVTPAPTVKVPAAQAPRVTPALAVKVTPPPAPTSAPPEPKRSAVIPVTLVDSAIDAYGGARYDTAAAMLRRALAGRGADSLNGARRATALMFLGASEWSRQSFDSANVAFRTLLVDSPRYVPDASALSRPVLDYFGGIRRSVYGVARILEREQAVTITVLAINPHHVSVDVCGEDGARVARIYDGPSADSLSFTWDRRAAGAAVTANGRYEVVVTARALDGRPLHVARFPLSTR